MVSNLSAASNVAPPTSFGIAFERLKNSVSKDDARLFMSTKMEDVWIAASSSSEDRYEDFTEYNPF